MMTDNYNTVLLERVRHRWGACVRMITEILK